MVDIYDRNLKSSRRIASANRQTNPWNDRYPGMGQVYGRDGIGLIPRRSMEDISSLQASLGGIHENSPLRLLSYMIDSDPSLSFAASNCLLLCNAPGDTCIVAEKSKKGGRSTTKVQNYGDETYDEQGTAEIHNLWNQLPPEVGGYQGIRKTLTLLVLCTGLPMVEGVPGLLGRGLSGVWPVDSLTTRLGRSTPKSPVTVYQRQIWTPTGATPFAKNGWVPINTPGLFWIPVDNWPDDPNGRAMYAPTVAEVFEDNILIRDVRDAVHNAAWPRLKFGFNFDAAHRQAVEIYKITDPVKAAAWVKARFEEYNLYAGSLNADDNVVGDTNGTTENLNGGNFQGLQGVLEFLRQRKLQAMKAWPSILGINDGSTQTYTSVEWAIYATGLAAIRGIVSDLLVQVADLHLRTLGLPVTAKAIEKPIRKSDALVDAQTAAVEIDNAIIMRDQGWITQEQASIRITGTGHVAEPPAPVPYTAGGASGKVTGQQRPPSQGGTANTGTKPGVGKES